MKIKMQLLKKRGKYGKAYILDNSKTMKSFYSVVVSTPDFDMIHIISGNPCSIQGRS